MTDPTPRAGTGEQREDGCCPECGGDMVHATGCSVLVKYLLEEMQDTPGTKAHIEARISELEAENAALQSTLADAKAAHVESQVKVSDAGLENVRSFVQGAQWWEFKQAGATMWGSDRFAAEVRATEMQRSGELGLGDEDRIAAREAAEKL